MIILKNVDELSKFPFRDEHDAPSLIGSMKLAAGKYIPDFRSKKATADPNYKSLLFEILEAKILNCRDTSQR